VVELLEDRTVLNSYTAGTVADLIADINAANAAGGSNTITLAAAKTFTLTAVNNTEHGPTGLPVIRDNLTIIGNGDTIARKASAHGFRLLDVAVGASLTLENLTLTGGLAESPPGGDADGGAILNNSGTLTLSAVTVTGNSAVGSGYVWNDGDLMWLGAAGVGGGICSFGGTLTLENGTLITNNSAVGYNNGDGYGGGVYMASGYSGQESTPCTATLTHVTISSNTATGGPSGKVGDWAGNARGGGLYVVATTAASTATLTNVTFSSDAALGGKGKSSGGWAEGGALCVQGIDYSGSVCTVTLTNCALSSNTAVGGDAASGFYPGGARGGAVAVGGHSPAVVTLSSDTITGNSAQAGKAGNVIGQAEGGGLCIFGVDALVYLDASTVANTKGNKPDNIYGSYTLIT
jgi:hypothetical protein